MARDITNKIATTSDTSSATRVITFSHALLFVLGFSLVFVIGWGGAATLLGQLFGQYKTLLSQIGGVIVILFGLHTIGILKLRWLDTDTRPTWQGTDRWGHLSSGMMGVVFAAGWTPCIGTILGAILTLGFSQETSGQAMVLASGYALGLGLPFLGISLLLDRAFVVTRRLRRYTRQVQIGSGLLLLVMGVLLLTNRLFYIAIWAQRNGLYLDPQLGQATAPTYLIAIFAGLLSFLSPCVLPLVPAYVSYLSGRTARR
jgi:cytochrome c-type biogenesis protein